MAYRNELEAAQARIAQLEEENRRLEREVARLSGAVALSDPPPAATPIGRPIWWPGHSWIMGGAQTPQGTLLAYTGEMSNQRYLRVARAGKEVLADHELADSGDEHTARIANGIVVPLRDRSLGWISWPGHEITRRLRLPAPIVAQPVAHEGELLAVTADRELLHVDPDAWRVVKRRSVGADELEKLGIPDPEGRNEHNGHNAPSSAKGLEKNGWSAAAVRRVGDWVLCAFNREFAGNDQVAAAVVERRSGKPLWFQEAGPGSFIYFYYVDGVVVLHNVSLEADAFTWGYRVDSGRLVFRIQGRGDRARLEIFDDGGQVTARSSV